MNLETTRAAALRRRRVAAAKQRRAERPTIAPVPPGPDVLHEDRHLGAATTSAYRGAGRATRGGAVTEGESAAAPSWPPTALDAFTAITQQAMDEARIISQVLERLEGTP